MMTRGALAVFSVALFLNTIVRGGSDSPFPADRPDSIHSSGETSQGEGAKAAAVAHIFQGDAVQDANQGRRFLTPDQPAAQHHDSDIAQDVPPAIWITRPKNDTVLHVGDVVIAFETRGFSSTETPVEVYIPQNGEAPSLLKGGGVFTLSVDMPCTQLVTLTATVRGQQHISTSVLFSTVLGREEIVSARAPLPTDARWGPRLEPAPSRQHTFEGGDNTFRIEHDTDNEPELQGSVDTGGLALQGFASEVGVVRPISVAFVGSLRLDGQKHVWLQQMEHLSRARFTSTYVTLEQAQSASVNNADAEQPASTWVTNAAEVFTERLRRAGVPLVKARLPEVDKSWIMGSSGGEVLSALLLQERAFGAVLASIDQAEGGPRLKSPLWAQQLFHRIADVVKGVSPDVLVVANGKTLGDSVLTRAARWAMRDSGCKIVMEFPNIDPAQGIDVDVLATPSHYVARHPGTKVLAEATGARVVVIPPGVQAAPPEIYSSSGVDNGGPPFNREPGGFHGRFRSDGGILTSLRSCDPDCHVLGFAGRLAPEKGPGLFMAAAEVVSKLIPSAVFVVVGDGPLKVALEAMAERLGISSRVHFTGWADGVDLHRLLAGMSLLFNPSLTPSETFSIINIQAMAVGTPVVAFGIAGMLEYLAPNVNALVLDDAEPHATGEAIADLLLDRPRLYSLAEKARLDVSLNFGEDTALNRWVDLYEVLARGGGS